MEYCVDTNSHHTDGAMALMMISSPRLLSDEILYGAMYQDEVCACLLALATPGVICVE